MFPFLRILEKVNITSEHYGKGSGVNKKKQFKRNSSDHHTLFLIQIGNKVKGTQIIFTKNIFSVYQAIIYRVTLQKFWINNS